MRKNFGTNGKSNFENCVKIRLFLQYIFLRLRMDLAEGHGLAVRLPPGPMVNCYELTRATAKAVLPTLHDATGINCIKLKRLPLDGTGLLVQQELDEADREHLIRILPDLPPLRGAISKGLEIMFMNAYIEHPEKLLWEPVFITEEDVTFNAWNIVALQVKHQALLQKKIDANELVAVNYEHNPIKQTGVFSYITRASALEFLREGAFYALNDPNAVEDAPPDARPDVQLAPVKVQEPTVETRLDASTAEPEVKLEALKNSTTKNARKKWDRLGKMELYVIWREAGGGGRGKGRGGVAAVQAEYPGMTRAHINKIVGEVEKKWRTKQPQKASYWPTP